MEGVEASAARRRLFNDAPAGGLTMQLDQRTIDSDHLVYLGSA